jgi:wobble nucleotide-excising tRNase
MLGDGLFCLPWEIMSHLISRNAYYVNKGGVNLMPTEDRNHDCEVERLEAELREIERIVLEILHIVRKIECELGEDCTE